MGKMLRSLKYKVFSPKELSPKGFISVLSPQLGFIVMARKIKSKPFNKKEGKNFTTLWKIERSNKVPSVFHASVLFVITNFVITDKVAVNPQTTLTML